MTVDVIGRDRELEELSAFLEAPVEELRALVIEGEVGIGKSTLWERAVAESSSTASDVLVARPAQGEAMLSFGVLADILTPVLPEVGPELPNPQRRALDVAVLQQDAGHVPLEARAVGAATLGALRVLSASGRIVLAVDDLQWVDPASAAALRFAIRRLVGGRVLVLGARRTEEGSSPGLDLEGAIDPAAITYLGLGPLSAAAVYDLLRAHLNLTLPRPAVMRVREMSHGNPFFALEIGRALQRANVTEPGWDLPVPERLRDLVRARLHELPDATVRALWAAAATTQPTLAMLKRVVDGVERSLQPAEAAGVIGIRLGRVRFSHPLLRAVLQQDVPADESRALHRRFADSTADPEERARHLALAADGPDDAVAEALEAAAREVRTRGAPDTAAELADQALELTPREREEDMRRRALAAADHHFDAGETSRARHLLEGLVSRAPPGPERSRVRQHLARVSMVDRGFPISRKLLLEALPEAMDAPDLRSAIERDLTMVLGQMGELASAAEHGRAAVEWAERADDPSVLAGALTELAFAEMNLGHGFRPDLMERALRISSPTGDAGPVSDPAFINSTMLWGVMLKWADDFDGARSLLERVLQAADQHGHESRMVPMLFQLGELECWAGRWDAAAECDLRAKEVMERAGYGAVGHAARYPGALAAACRGDLDQARELATENLGVAESLGDARFMVRYRHVLGLVDLSLEDASSSYEHLSQAARVFFGAGFGEPGGFRFIPDAVEASIGVGDLTLAEELTEWQERRGRELDRPWALATGARCRALLRAEAGTLEEALEAVDRSLIEHHRLAMPLERGRTLLTQGVILRRLKRKRAARESLHAAGEIFEALGAALWGRRASAEVERTGIRGGNGWELTPTEHRVAALVAEGHTNREVAASLSLSPRTVESNLSRIYRKLGVRSRTELARRFSPPPASPQRDSPDSSSGSRP